MQSTFKRLIQGSGIIAFNSEGNFNIKDSIRPDFTRPRYLEICSSDLEIVEEESKSGKSKRLKVSLPEITYNGRNIGGHGNVHLFTFHPKLGLGTHVIELSVGESIWKDFNFQFGNLSTEMLNELPYFVRIYEINSAVI